MSKTVSQKAYDWDAALQILEEEGLQKCIGYYLLKMIMPFSIL